MSVAAIAGGHVAVVTGGAAGIGLAAAVRFAQAGMVVVIADTRESLFGDAQETLRAAGAAEVLARKVDVSDRAALVALEAEVRARFGTVHVLMNNAGIQPGSDIFDAAGTWARVLAVNLMGVVNGSQVFAPGMIAGGAPGLIINTGSKQGITTPPGDPAYNLSKSGVKTFTEALEHELREATEGRVSAHLLIPGFVFTDLTRRDRTDKPAGAWTAGQTADFMMDSLARGDFYILCPDNEVDRTTDEKRMAWAIGDIIENRPPLSRWAKGYAEKFEAFLRSKS